MESLPPRTLRESILALNPGSSDYAHEFFDILDQIRREVKPEDPMWLAYCFFLEEYTVRGYNSRECSDAYRNIWNDMIYHVRDPKPYLGLNVSSFRVIHERVGPPDGMNMIMCFPGELSEDRVRQIAFPLPGRYHARTKKVTRKELKDAGLVYGSTIDDYTIKEWANHVYTPRDSVYSPPANDPMRYAYFDRVLFWISAFSMKAIRIFDWYTFPDTFRKLPPFIQCAVFQVMGNSDRVTLVNRLGPGDCDLMAIEMFQSQPKPWIETMRLLKPVAQGGFESLIWIRSVPAKVSDMCARELIERMDISLFRDKNQYRGMPSYTVAETILHKLPLWQLSRAEFAKAKALPVYDMLIMHGPSNLYEFFKRVAIALALKHLPSEIVRCIVETSGHVKLNPDKR